MLVLNQAVGYLVRMLLQPVTGTQVFCNYLDSCDDAIEVLSEHGCKISAVASETKYEIRYSDNNQYSVIVNPDIQLFKPIDKFHFAFTFPPFTDDGNPIPITDKAQFFECSRGKNLRVVDAHIVAAESALKSVLTGGFAVTIMPKKWIGRDMWYMRWWNENAAQVCRIKLPLDAVQIVDERGNISDKDQLTRFELCIWQHPVNNGNDNGYRNTEDAPNSGNCRMLTEFATFRYSPFIFTMESLSSDQVEKCGRAFRKHDWWANSVNLYRKMLEKNPMHSVYGNHKTHAHHLSNPKDIHYLTQSVDKAAKVSIVKTIEEIKALNLAVQIKPGPPVKFSAFNPQSLCRLHDVKLGGGTSRDDEGNIVLNFTEELNREMYSALAEKLLKVCHEADLVPCMLEQDALKIKRQEHWLSIQLTPIERIIPIKGAEDDAATQWETVFEDTGMLATHPEVMHMWRKRAKAMRMDTLTYDFQFNNLIIGAAKQSMLLSDVMGLGKTRQSLMIPLLRGVQHVLLIVPAKLIGVWQQEIESTLAAYVRLQRKDWQHKTLSASYQVIEHAEDCLPRNLRRFNIISYDKLKSLPRDGKAFKCPKCGVIAFKRFEPNHHHPQAIVCPGDPNVPEENRCSHVIVNWQNYCKTKGLRKHKVSLVTGKKIHWNNLQAEVCRVVDERPEKPKVQLMEAIDVLPRKVTQYIASYEYNQHTGIRTPVIAERERKNHVAWTFADLIRWSFNYVIADEALYFKNYDAKRTVAIHHVCGRSRLALTGTPVKGYPQAVLSILNWTLKKQIFPLYRNYDRKGEQRFLARYKTVVKINSNDGKGGQDKQVPKINNPELFQAEIAPFMRRNTRNQPNVLKDIPRKEQALEILHIDMDEQHKEYYNKWLQKFSEWWQKMKEDVEKKKVRGGELITKISYLINASTIPHYMLDSIRKSKDADVSTWAMMIGPYRGPIHAKMKRVMELIQQTVVKGEKIIVFSTRHKNLDLGHAWCQRNNIFSMVVDGRVSLKINPATNRSPRQELIDKFRNYDYSVMWAGLEALAEGMNIPEANNGFILDYSWDPTTWKQAIGRMIRPQQTRTVNGVFTIHTGTIDDYMAALCLLKEKSVDESIDYCEFDDFHVELIPDIRQYADAIVDGTHEVQKRKMWLAVDHIRKLREEGEDENEEE